jgi:hypothetical protein
MGMRGGEAMTAHVQHGPMAMMPEGGMYYGPPSMGGRVGPQQPGRAGGGGGPMPAAGRAMYLNRAQPYMDQQLHHAGMHGMEGRPPPGYHSQGGVF